MKTRILETAKTAKGMAVFARIEIPCNAEIDEFVGYVVEENTQHSVTLNGKKIEPTGILRFLSHSCEPNTFFKGRMLYTSKNIPRGGELSIDYLVTEKSFSHPFICQCGSTHCRGNIT